MFTALGLRFSCTGHVYSSGLIRPLLIHTLVPAKSINEIFKFSIDVDSACQLVLDFAVLDVVNAGELVVQDHVIAAGLEFHH